MGGHCGSEPESSFIKKVRHSRAGGNPVSPPRAATDKNRHRNCSSLDSRLRGNDDAGRLTRFVSICILPIS
ncbi:MAG: hypothetical protein JWP89_2312 [Schlesneria sp.]|nr:hypothetical protein [Schlesneria sp.]